MNDTECFAAAGLFFDRELLLLFFTSKESEEDYRRSAVSFFDFLIVVSEIRWSDATVIFFSC